MGCICSKGSKTDDHDAENKRGVNKVLVKVSAPLQKEEVRLGVVGNTYNSQGSLHLKSSKTASESNPVRPARVEDNGKTRILERPKNGSARVEGNGKTIIIERPKNGSARVEDNGKTRIVERPKNGSARVEDNGKTRIIERPKIGSARIEDNGKTIIIERPKYGHIRSSTMDLGRVLNGMQQTVSAIPYMPHGSKGEQVAAGWPMWLASVAGEAIQGWTPRCADSYEKLSKIGQGTYSSVYKARDLKTEKIVAMKKVRFVNMDPESVRFMAREISILRRLDHPNVMKLEALVISRISGSFYLVFEYMEHDLAGLLASPNVKFTESQIKCYMQQMFRGLEHCHGRGILHRDIKGSNLLVDNKGILKIGDFGLATLFEPDQKQPLTSRVVTLWYRAPELLLGTTEYGVAIDMWSAGCILAELFAGKPIMPGRTEVEQMHKIFKLCGSPTEDYLRKIKLPGSTSFKSQPSYNRCLADTIRDFPSSAIPLVETLLSIDPEERGTASSALKSEFFTSSPLPCDPSTLPKYPPSKEFDVKIREEEARRQRAESGRGQTHYEKNYSRRSKVVPEGQEQSNKRISDKYNNPPDSHSMRHPSARRFETRNNGGDHSIPARTLSSLGGAAELIKQASQLRPSVLGSSNYRSKDSSQLSNNDSLGYVQKRNRILCSGPLIPPGGNMDDMLKEHERHIQDAVRKARLDKATSRQKSDKKELL